MDKFALVYEFNKESPLITYMASKEIDAQNYDKAITLLQTAIEKYPFYPTPYFLYSIALVYSKKIDEAKDVLTKGDNLLNDKNTFEYYKNKIDEISREIEGIHFNLNKTVSNILDESFIEPEKYDETKDLELIDGELVESEPKDYDKDIQQSIITETLAEIYASQGNYEEAIEIYEKLKDLKPELVEKFENRISEINLENANKNK